MIVTYREYCKPISDRTMCRILDIEYTPNLKVKEIYLIIGYKSALNLNQPANKELS